MALELKPGRTVKTLAYNGQVPGPLLRARRGRPITVDVHNDTKDEDIVHWHGFHIPSDVDGAFEEGTPGVPPNGGRRRYRFTPDPPGTRWYHSHATAGRNLKKSTYTGQFGLFVVESGDEPGSHDLEVPIFLHEWDPRLTTQGPTDVTFRYYSINGKMLGGGEPVRVRQGQRALFRIVNASATLHHKLALPGHRFRIMALDGNAVATPASVGVVELGPGERVDAIVEMNQPGVWILGETRTAQRDAGMGIAIEYAGQPGPPRWLPPGADDWSYLLFATLGAAAEPDGPWSSGPPTAITGPSTANRTRASTRSSCARTSATAGCWTIRVPMRIPCIYTDTPSSWFASPAGLSRASGKTWSSCPPGASWRSMC